MTDAYAETDIWPNPPATPTPAPDRTESAPDASRVLGDAPTATDAREALLRAERDTYRKQWHQEVENFERETVRAEAAEARLRAVEALADKWDQIAERTSKAPGLQEAANLTLYIETVRYLVRDFRAALASAAPAVSDGEGATSEADRSLQRQIERQEYGRFEAIGRYLDSQPCASCGGDRLRPDFTDAPRCHAPASPVVAPSATEAPQAPAEEEGEAEVIALIWREHSNCNWVSTGHHVQWSCGIIHGGPIHMQPTTRDRHVAALVMTQVKADEVLARLAPSPRPDTADDEGVS